MSVTDQHSHHPILGIVLKVASVLFFAGMAASVKYVGSDLPTGQTVFFRGLIAMLVIALVAWRTEGLRVLKTDNWRAHALRSIAGAVSMFCWFIALTMIPLGAMTAISFTTPLFLTVLAMVFLGERIHWYRWTALGVGFVGVLVIIAPQLSADRGSPLGVAVALSAAILAGFALMFLRRMSGHEHALTITFYFFVTSTALAAVTWLFGGWPMPTPSQWFVLGLVGIFGVFGQLFMTFSYRYAEASMLAPLDYTNLLVSIAIGFYVFGEIPHVATWTGAPLVIGAGGIILWREYSKHRAVRSAQQLPH